MSFLARLTDQVLDDKYRIEKLLGEGGMGAVFQATHIGTQRPVAVKVIAPQFMAIPEFVERFRREAEAAGRLRHPNIVDVTDFGFAFVEGQRIAYLVMEYLDGCSLAEVLKEEIKLPLAFVVDIIEQVGSAMAEAHGAGIIHRDLKPDNIWLEPNRRGGFTVKVLDFGLAKPQRAETKRFFPGLSAPDGFKAETTSPGVAPAFQAPRSLAFSEASTLVKPGTVEESADPQPVFEEVVSEAATRITPPPTIPESPIRATVSADVTRVGTILGTPPYMSPEQCRGEATDARSDIYSLGIITYQMLVGAAPFTGETQQVLASHISEPPPPVRELRKDIPKRVAQLVMSALEKDPAKRPATAAAFANALRARSEGMATMLRQAVSLYSEHFPVFIQISLLAYAPQILAGFLEMVGPATRRAGWSLELTTGAAAGVFGLAATLAKYIIPSLFAPVVIQVIEAPLRKVSLRPLFSVLKMRLKDALVTLVANFFFTFFWFCLFFLPGVVALVNYSLCFPVMLLEGLRGKAALKRSAELVKRLWWTAAGILFLQLLVGTWIVEPLSGAFAKTWVSLLHLTGNRAEAHLSEICQTVLGVWITPIFTIAMAIFYARARQAGGESLKDVLKTSGEEPLTGWQARIRDRTVARSR